MPGGASGHPIELSDTNFDAFLGKSGDNNRASLMLEAHEALCRADERNEPKFHDVKELLREEIARQSSYHK